MPSCTVVVTLQFVTTTWPRMLKLKCVHIIWTKEDAYLFSRSNVKFKALLALGSLWAGYSKNCGLGCSNFNSVYTSYGKRKKPNYFQGQISRSLDLYKNSCVWMCVGRI